MDVAGVDRTDFGRLGVSPATLRAAAERLAGVLLFGAVPAALFA